MAEAGRVLIVGESWVTHSIHQKGFDSFTTTSYHEGVGPLRDALLDGAYAVDYLPNHLAASHFPESADDLARYGAVILSDIGANTLQLHPDTFDRSVPHADRLRVVRDYVAAGGGLIMVGGYLSFQGIDARARYAGTPVEEALPVSLERVDDRVETPGGAAPSVRLPDHPIVAGVSGAWPQLLGYNRVQAKPGADMVVSVGPDPLIVAGRFEQGRSAVFTSDCGPHWCPPPFVDWEGYPVLWRQLVAWVFGRD
ncbi:MAG: cytoplasmic protein [Chloroflexi bacterium]|nr:cytoplasmic protein [Chloroflexota bacterium]